jgi:PST family polysaccharide transporter
MLGAVWSNLSFIATRALSTLWLLVLARLLVPSEFGVFAIVTLYLGLSELISDMGMNATVVYEQEAGYTERLQTAFTLNILVAVFLTVVGLALAGPLAHFFHVESHVGLFRLAALNPLFKGFGNMHDALLQRGMQFRRRMQPEVLMVFVRGFSSIALAVAGLGAESLVIGTLVGSLAWSAMHWILTPFRPSLRLDRAIARTMVSYGSGAVAVNVAAAIGTRLDVMVIGRVLNARALGLYSVAFRIPELLIEGVAWNMAIVAFPALSRKRVADEQGLPHATARIIHYQALYALPLGAGMAVLGPQLIVTVFGHRWAAAGGVASAIAVMAAISALTFPLGDVFKALGRQRLLVAIGLLQLPVIVAALILSAPAGIIAVAWVRTAWALLHATLVTIAACRVLSARLTLFVHEALPAVVAALGVAAGAGLVRIGLGGTPAMVLVVGALAGAAGGIIALRLLSSRTFDELAAQAAELAAHLQAGFAARRNHVTPPATD